MTVIDSAVTINSGAVLTIEAGAVVRFSSASSVIVVKGTLWAIGRPDAQIIFDGGDVSVGATALYCIGDMNVNVAYSTFSKFGRAVVLESSMFAGHLHVADCNFQENIAPVGGNNYYTVSFLRCQFARNLQPSTGIFKALIDGCYFHNQVGGVSVDSPSTIVNSVFVNLTGTALRIASGSTVSNCLFVGNDIAVRSTIQTYSSTLLQSCIFLNNRVSVVVGYTLSITGGWMCGRPFDSTSDLIRMESPHSITASEVWFGISGQFEAIIRGSIKDEYWTASSGLVALIQVQAQPTPWPAVLQPYNSSYASLCLAPQDRGLDLFRPPSGASIFPTEKPRKCFF